LLFFPIKHLIINITHFTYKNSTVSVPSHALVHLHTGVYWNHTTSLVTQVIHNC